MLPMRALYSLCAALIVVGCGPEASLLVVDVRTDLAPGVELDAVRTEIVEAPGSAAGRSTTTSVDGSADGLAGIRVAELAEVPRGDVEILVTLQLDGDRVAERTVRFQHTGQSAITVVIQRSCEALGCAPGTACFGDACVDPRCTLATPERCGDPQCAADADCAGGAPCSTSACVGGACLYPPDDGTCPSGQRCDPDRGCVDVPDAGGPDAGVDAGAPGDAGVPDTDCDGIHASRAFCEGFEGPGVGSFNQQFPGIGSIDRETTLVYRGRGAMRFTKPDGAGAGSVYLGTDALNGLGAGDHLYARGIFYVPSDVTIFRFNMIYMGVERSNALEVTALVDDALRMGLPPGTTELLGGMGTVPRDRWFCLEAHLEIGNGGQAEVSVDGGAVLQVASNPETPAGPTDILIVGLPWSPMEQGAATIYLDEFVASTDPIGCD